MKKLITLAVLATTLSLAGCDQWMARQGFGAMTQTLKCDTKLEMVTWKGQNAELWVLTRPMRKDEVPENHVFKASTLMGVFEGQVTFKESRCAH